MMRQAITSHPAVHTIRMHSEAIGMHRLAPHLPPKFLLECIALIQGKLEAPLNLGLGQARRAARRA